MKLPLLFGFEQQRQLFTPALIFSVRTKIQACIFLAFIGFIW